MDCSTPCFPVLHYVLDFAEIHAHWWFCLTISSSATPFSFLPSIFPRIKVFLNQSVFTSGDQNIGASASTSVQFQFCSVAQLCPFFASPWIAACQASLSITNSWSLLKLKSIQSMIPASVFPVNIQGWYPLGLTGLISLLFRGLLWVFPSTTVWKHQFFSSQPSLRSNSHIRSWLLGKTIALTIQDFISKVMSLLFDTLSRFAIASLPKRKCLLISWLQLLSVVILEPRN